MLYAFSKGRCGHFSCLIPSSINAEGKGGDDQAPPDDLVGSEGEISDYESDDSQADRYRDDDNSDDDSEEDAKSAYIRQLEEEVDQQYSMYEARVNAKRGMPETIA